MNLPEKIFLDESHTHQVFDEIDNFQVEIDSTEYDDGLVKGYDRIVIVGPQRSGTTFTSQALSETLSFRNVDEGEFDVRNVELFKNIFREKNIVVQAPAMTCRIQKFVGEKDLVIFMVRKWSDIVKSLYKKNGRISNWIIMDTLYDVEKFYFTEYDSNAEKFYNNHVDRDSYYLDAYYKMWKHYQKDIIPNAISLEYESMKNHPTWIDKKHRKNFHEKQTRL
jgi:hypothetical protein